MTCLLFLLRSQRKKTSTDSTPTWTPDNEVADSNTWSIGRDMNQRKDHGWVVMTWCQHHRQHQTSQLHLLVHHHRNSNQTHLCHSWYISSHQSLHPCLVLVFTITDQLTWLLTRAPYLLRIPVCLHQSSSIGDPSSNTCHQPATQIRVCSDSAKFIQFCYFIETLLI